MERTWKPTTAGILSIIGGIAGIVIGAVATLGISMVSMVIGFEWLAGIGVGLIIMGVIALIGGIYALKRKKWGMALAGAIFALFPIVPLGILAIIFVAMGKNEFD